MALEPVTRGLWRYREPAGERGDLPGGPCDPTPGSPDPAGRTVVVAPYGGGSAYSMADLLRHLTPVADETLVLQYPGRGPRIGEPPPSSLHDLADQLAADIDQHTTGALVLVGHSLGGLLCFELAHRLAPAGRHVELLVISSAQPTALTTLRADEIAVRDDDRWTSILRRDAGGTAELLDNPEMLRLAIGALRGDTLLAARHSGSPQPLDCPMLIVGGADDPDITAAHLRGWAELTAGTATTVLLPGGHFYYRDEPAGLSDLVRRHLPPRPGTDPAAARPTQGETT